MRVWAALLVGAAVLACAGTAIAAPEATVAIDAAAVGGSVPPLGVNVMQDGSEVADPLTGAPDTGVTSFLARNLAPQIVRWHGLGGDCYDPANTDRAVRQQQTNQGNHNCDWTDYNGVQTPDFFNVLQQMNPSAQALMEANPCWVKSANAALGGTPNRPACNVLATGQGTEACPTPPTVCPGATIHANWLAQMRAAGQPRRYWELGNEVFANGNVPPDTYRQISDAYVAALKQADPTVLVGGDANDFGANPAAWDAAVGQSTVDFFSTHLYWPNKSDLFSSLSTTGLPIGYKRIQNWAFTVPAAGTYQVAVDAKATGADAALAITVDPRAGGGSTATGSATLTNGAAPVRTALAPVALAAGRHEISIQVGPSTPLGAAPTVALGQGWTCTSTCPEKGACASGCSPIDLGDFPDDNPYAIGVLSTKHGLTRTLTAASGPASLRIGAYAVPSGSTCPTLKLQVDNGAWLTLTTAKTGGTLATQDACYSFAAPLVQTVPGVTLAAGSHTLHLALGGTAGEVEVTSAEAIAGGQPVGSADLSPNAGGHDAFARFTYAGLGSEAHPGPVRARLASLESLAASTQKSVMVSEFGAQFLSGFQASTAEGETLMAALYDAAAVQTFTRQSPALLGMVHWALDNLGFRTMHCSATSAWDLPWEHPCATQPPFNSTVGWVFSMLKDHLHNQWVRTDTTAPSFTVDQPIYDADGTPVSVNPNSTTDEVQALATKGAGVIDVQLVNLASHPVTTEITIAGAAPAGTATLQTIGGDPSAVDGCRLDAFNYSWGCAPAAVVPGAPQALPAAADTTVTLPASSFSVLSAPAS